MSNCAKCITTPEGNHAEDCPVYLQVVVNFLKSNCLIIDGLNIKIRDLEVENKDLRQKISYIKTFVKRSRAFKAFLKDWQ